MVGVEGDDVHHAAVYEAAGGGEAPSYRDDDDDDNEVYKYLMMPREDPDCCTWALTRYRPPEEHRD